MAFDLKITGGELVDGSGGAKRQADIGIVDGRIVAIGDVDGSARQTLDASGKIVAPGFVDLHTHYDAQVFWDGSLSPSCYHGVTSVVGGNCGFSVAPLAPEHADYLMQMLARVEGMPLESLRAGVPWDWRSFGDYLDRLEGELALNAGFLVGHSAIRRVVMGERSVGFQANDDELREMQDLLRRSLAEGGLGFSTSVSGAHNDADGQPVPSRHASRDEFLALAAVLREQPGSSLEIAPPLGIFDEALKALMADLSIASNRVVNWNVLAGSARNREMVDSQLDASEYARERGARVVALTAVPSGTLWINLRTGVVFDNFHGWADVFKLSIEERKKHLSDPDVRKRLDSDARSEASGLTRQFSNWSKILIRETFSPENARFTGRTVGEAARELGVEPFDALLDIAIADDLRTSFSPRSGDTTQADWEVLRSLWLDDRTIVGASDAGAHLDMLDMFATSTRVLGTAVREQGILSLEDAVRQLTDVPARLYGLRERGQIAEGWKADVVIFDEKSIACEPTFTRDDLPAGATRLYAEAKGIAHVLVNGIEIVRDGEATGERPGAILRAGRDTESVALS
ncbi:amidohydrolase family protein [Myxococcota bacterium]|nr:amidohydrolase family protein [Myxococcota bacterium]